MNGVNLKDLAVDLRKQLDAQRLRADTAEADLLRTSDALLAAEQRNANLVGLLSEAQQAMPWASNSELWERIHAALNPKPEAESHE